MRSFGSHKAAALAGEVAGSIGDLMPLYASLALGSVSNVPISSPKLTPAPKIRRNAQFFLGGRRGESLSIERPRLG